MAIESLTDYISVNEKSFLEGLEKAEKIAEKEKPSKNVNAQFIRTDEEISAFIKKLKKRLDKEMQYGKISSH